MPESTITTDESFQADDSKPLSRTVFRAVADAEGVDQTELEPLYYAIDPDKLDALFRPQLQRPGAPDATAEIQFSYHGYEVRATATGRVSLTEQ